MELKRPEFLNDMTFVDSWKDYNVQLLGGMALAGGTAALVAQGKKPEIARAAGKAFKNVEKSWDRFLFRRLGKGGKIFYPIGKRIAKQVGPELKETRRANKPLTRDEYIQKAEKKKAELKQSDIDDKAVKFREEDEFNWKRKNVINDTSEPFNAEPFSYYQEKAKMELLGKNEGTQKQQNQQRKPFFTKEKGLNTAAEAAGATMAGVAFATGISLVHAFNDNPKAKTSFEVAGSVLKDEPYKKKQDQQFKNQSFKPQNNYNNQQRYNGPYKRQEYRDKDRNNNSNNYRGYSNMRNDYRPKNSKYPEPTINKEASARDVYDTLFGSPGKKVGNAVLSGLGFGGVSYGLTEMNKRNEAKKKDKKEGSRIIIEFGDTTNDSNMLDGGTGLIPRPNFNKEASLQNFLKNVGGRKGELRELDTKIKQHNYHRDAVMNANKGDLDTEFAPYKNIYKDQSQAMNRYLDDARDSLKQQDMMKVEQIKDDVAAARLPVFLGGTGLAGAAGTYQLSKDDER